MSQTTAETLVTVARASRECGVAHWTLRRLIAEGRIPSVSIAGVKRVRISAVRSAIEEFPVGVGCQKFRHATQAAAEDERERLERRGQTADSVPLETYFCQSCRSFHVGHDPRS